MHVRARQTKKDLKKGLENALKKQLGLNRRVERNVAILRNPERYPAAPAELPLVPGRSALPPFFLPVVIEDFQ